METKMDENLISEIEETPEYKDACRLSYRHTKPQITDNLQIRPSVLSKESLQKDHPNIDYRPLPINGTWRAIDASIDKEFALDDIDDPHIKRKIAILSRHPEIRDLYGPDPLTKYIILGCVGTQILATYLCTRVFDLSFPALLVVAYVVGASMTQLMGIIFHEISHQLLSLSPAANKIFGIIGNIIIPVPIAVSFSRYHLDHHAYQGVLGKDPDLPFGWEKWLIGNRWYTKCIWIFFYPMLYILRGAMIGKDITAWEIINWTVILLTNFANYLAFGTKGMAYLAISTWFGFGIHPVAAHFVQEHYVFTDGQETYSYYGWWNRLFMNIGYHNEHHDFPNISWRQLPKVKEIAGEFYNGLASHNSWFMVYFNFIFDRKMGPQCRAIREMDSQKKGRRMIKVGTKHKFLGHNKDSLLLEDD